MTRANIIEINNLCHYYGKKRIYEDLSLKVEAGKIFGILGKNGVGKSTLINILMGYIKPRSGQCLVMGELSHNLSAHTKSQIGLLHEGFIAYDFMSIAQIEQFFSPFYSHWQKDLFYELVDLMDLTYTQKLSSLSYGQKSQVILGLLFAQNAKLLIFDDYSMGLDAGYRKLFIEYLKNYVQKSRKTVLITSHIMGDLIHLIDEMIIVQRGGTVYKDSMSHFIANFKCYELDKNVDISKLNVHRVENHKDRKLLYTFDTYDYLAQQELDFEDQFLGYVGKY